MPIEASSVLIISTLMFELVSW